MASIGLRFACVSSIALALTGCAEERAPINRVQANALAKSFFVGSLADPGDDPEFFSAATVVDTPFGADQAGVFPGMVGGLRRVKFEITEDYLNVRMTHEDIDGTDGHGQRTTDNGRVIASYSVLSHFDIKRAYNPNTGEEQNVIEENTTDRPWYLREYLRVDWSTNLIESSFSWDPMAQQSGFGDSIETEPLSYYVNDPQHPDAPLFDTATGYFDVTNRVYLKPKQVTLFGQTVSACLYRASIVIGATAPFGNCENTEVTLRWSFRRVAHQGEPGFTDYEPQHWDGERANAFGVFTSNRLGNDPHYGILDTKWYRFANRYNIWQTSHVDLGCDVPDPQVASAVDQLDANHDGTDDVCEGAGLPGSRCDDLVGKCTLPFARREIRPVPWHYTVGPDGDRVIRDWTFRATQEWDAALRVAVQAGRRVECQHTGGRSTEGTPWAGQPCEQAFPIDQRDDADMATVRAVYECWDQNGYGSEACASLQPANSIASLRPVVVFCDNPVPPGADPACGPAGTRVRPGDLRYHHLNIWPTRQSSSPWGYGPTLADPLSGEVISAGINVYDFVTWSAAQSYADQVRWMNGDVKGTDLSSGRFIKDWAASSAGHSAQRELVSPPLLDRSETDRRVGRVHESPVALPAAPALTPAQQADVLRHAQRDLASRQLPNDLSANPRAVFDARIQAAKDSPVEAELLNNLWLQLGGVDGQSPLTDEVLDRVSPLRGLSPRAVVQAEQQLHRQLAAIGQCMVGAPEPTGLPSVAKMMATKFPGDPNDPARVARMVDYLRGRMHYSVILHEMGHTVGFRHNFVSSFDSTNFRPQYWQLRTHNGRDTDRCTTPTPDGEGCVGPRYLDGLSQEELDGSIWTWQHTTVMDYPGEITQDMLGLGVYDYAGARMFYTGVADVAADPALVSDHPSPDDPTDTISGTSAGNQLVDQVDNTGGLVGQLVQDSNGRFTHYSERHNVFNLLRNCQPADTSAPAGWDTQKDGVYDPVFDGHIVLGTRCERMPVDYVSYSDLSPDRLQDALSVDPRFFTARRARDAQGRPRMPYGYESDEYADGWSPSTYRHDNGADLYEELTFHSNLYENRHLWDDFRNGRVTFTVYGAYNRAITRYHVKLSELTQGVSYLFGWYLKEYARNSNVPYAQFVRDLTGPDGQLRDMVIGAGVGFDHFVRVLTRPHVGQHTLAEADHDGLLNILEPIEDVISGSTPIPFATVPNGTTITAAGDITFGGRPLNNGFQYGNGYYTSDYLDQVGSYYEKALSTELMMSASYNVFNFYRFDGLDGRFHHNNFTDMWPNAMRQMVGSMLTGDRLLFGPRMTADGSGYPETEFDPEDSTLLWPKQPLGWVTYLGKTGPEVCWPKNGVLQCYDGAQNPIGTGSQNAPNSITVDPQLGYEVQKFIAFYTYVYMPAAEENDWVDAMRVYVVGKDQNPDYLPAQRIEWFDPVSGLRYIARRYGDETLLGKTYDQGIAAKMIQWANQLTAQAYETDAIDPVTREATVRLDASGNPVLKGNFATCSDSRACDELRKYRGLLDFMRDTAARLGFPEPALQVYGGD